jgi:hypothetical protein
VRVRWTPHPRWQRGPFRTGEDCNQPKPGTSKSMSMSMSAVRRCLFWASEDRDFTVNDAATAQGRSALVARAEAINVGGSESRGSFGVSATRACFHGRRYAKSTESGQRG